MIWTTIAAMAMLAAPSLDQSADPRLPEWMAGCWEQQDGERWTEECWMAPRAGIMLGASRSGRGAKLGSWEAMQITASDGADAAILFWASPAGGARTRFVRLASAEPGLTFGNIENAYPQRIRYWREGENLMAEISMADGSRPMRWTYRPAMR